MRVWRSLPHWISQANHFSLYHRCPACKVQRFFKYFVQCSHVSVNTPVEDVRIAALWSDLPILAVITYPAIEIRETIYLELIILCAAVCNCRGFMLVELFRMA